MSHYQICTNCLMDTTDPNISFNEEGVCSHCTGFKDQWDKYGYNENRSEIELKQIVEKIKQDGINKKYDCIIGLSGGVDSSYLVHTAHKLGLRVLAMHIDAGWNSEIAVQNIHKICKKLNIDLYTEVLDWETMKELQRAYMFSGLANLDIPQDHAFVAGVYDYAIKYKIKYMLNGSNMATEGILPDAWGNSAFDYRSIKDVFKKYKRKGNLKKYPHFSFLRYYIMRRKINRIDLLNYVPYSKKDAMSILENEYKWKYYGGKHFESRFTKFFQSYYLPVKFGFDKRRAHLSSLIQTGEMTRDEALNIINDTNFYPEKEMIEDRNYILKKLDLTYEDWDKIMKSPNKTEDDYKSNKKMMEPLVKIKKMMTRLVGRKPE